MLSSPEFKKKYNEPFKINRTYDIPYVAGYSKDGKTIFIDRHLTLTDDGVNIEPFLIVHEHTEKTLIDLFGLDYQEAHKLATYMEDNAVKKSGKLDDHQYESHYSKFIKPISREALKRVPKDLDLTPYKDEKDYKVLKAIVTQQDRESVS